VVGRLLPAKEEDFATLLNYFLVQRAMGVFNSYLRRDPKRLIIPQTIMRNVLRPDAETVVPAAVTAAVAPVAAAVGVAPAASVAAVAPVAGPAGPKPADVVAEKSGG
jgi:hypothetical protein